MNEATKDTSAAASHMLSTMNAALVKLASIDSIADLYKLHGIDPSVSDRPLKQERLTYNADSPRPYDVAQYAAQKEIGVPGTNIVDGRIKVEHNPRLYPGWARGRISRPGLLEEIYKTEPIAFKSINEITALACNATYDVTYPDDTDAQTREIAERADKALKNVDEGMQNTLEAMSTAFKLGFAAFEPVWQTKADGFQCIKKLAFREQSTVDRWLFDERESELLGADFEPRTGKRYTLTKGGTYATERLVLVNINAVGNNVEGVAPLRVVVGLRKLKELILQISGVSHQKYGVPIAIIVRELANASASLLPELGSEANQAELRRIITRLQNMRATIAPVLDMPIGTTLQYATPTNDMPDVVPLMHYIDTMIALCFHNEGALLGSQSFGSYSMASVSDSKFMRAAPVYASRIGVAFTEILHHMIRWNHDDPDSIESWPSYSFRFAGTQDASKWTDDMAKLVAAQVWTWPDEPRRMAAANMGLSVEAFDEWIATSQVEVDAGPVTADVVPGTEQPTDEVQNVAQSAMNGAQITSMVDVVQQVSAGALPAAAAVKILVRGFNMSQADAQALIDDANTGSGEEAAKAQGIHDS